MLPGNLLEALAHGCANCGRRFDNRHRIKPAYRVNEITSFYNQVALGIIGAQARNFWVHLDCEDPTVKDTKWKMNPDINHCIACGEGLATKDIVTPVFQVIDPRAVNPNDLTDIGIALNDRIYFVHADCANRELNKRGSNLLVTG